MERTAVQQVAATNRLSLEPPEEMNLAVLGDVPNGVKKDDDPNHIDIDPASSVPPGPVYYFGCRLYHPEWLQKLADAKFYTFILVLFVVVEGAITSGERFGNGSKKY